MSGAWLALTGVNYHRNELVSKLVNRWLALTILGETGRTLVLVFGSDPSATTKSARRKFTELCKCPHNSFKTPIKIKIVCRKFSENVTILGRKEEKVKSDHRSKFSTGFEPVTSAKYEFHTYFTALGRQ